MRERGQQVLAVLLGGLLFVSACTRSGQAEQVADSVPEPLETTTTTEVTTTTTDPGVEQICDIPEYFPADIPDRALVAQPPPSEAPFHPYLLLGGTSNSFLVGADGEAVVAVIRGSLPPEPWAADPEVITILDGVPAALGPLSDGMWAVAWVLSEHDPCDQYTLVLFPPTSAEEARRVALSLHTTA